MTDYRQLGGLAGEALTRLLLRCVCERLDRIVEIEEKVSERNEERYRLADERDRRMEEVIRRRQEEADFHRARIEELRAREAQAEREPVATADAERNMWAQSVALYLQRMAQYERRIDELVSANNLELEKRRKAEMETAQLQAELSIYREPPGSPELTQALRQQLTEEPK